MSDDAQPAAAEPILAGVELGGTKSIAVIGSRCTFLEREVVPTTTPEQTLGRIADLLSGWSQKWKPAALGIAAFGPIEVNPRSFAFGRMLTTPKPGWAGAEIVRSLAGNLAVPTGLHTDATGAALAEGLWGAARGLTDFVYVTIGTGVGMGIVSGGHPISGAMHPEAGHLRVRRLPWDRFAGCCPYHHDCLEGLASGPAIQARTGRPAAELGADHEAWVAVADALAEGFSSLFLTLAPTKIIVGGGVGLGQPHLLPMIRKGVHEKLAGYLPHLTDGGLSIVQQAQLGTAVGPLGALALAHRELYARTRIQAQ